MPIRNQLSGRESRNRPPRAMFKTCLLPTHTPSRFDLRRTWLPVQGRLHFFSFTLYLRLNHKCDHMPRKSTRFHPMAERCIFRARFNSYLVLWARASPSLKMFSIRACVNGPLRFCKNVIHCRLVGRNYKNTNAMIPWFSYARHQHARRWTIARYNSSTFPGEVLSSFHVLWVC